MSSFSLSETAKPAFFLSRSSTESLVANSSSLENVRVNLLGRDLLVSVSDSLVFKEEEEEAI